MIEKVIYIEIFIGGAAEFQAKTAKQSLKRMVCRGSHMRKRAKIYKRSKKREKAV